MSDAQAIIHIQAEMNDRLSGALQRINGQLSNTVRSLNGLKATSQSAVGATNAVGAAITKLSRQSNSLNGSLRTNVLSQQALSASFRNSSIQANALNAQLGRLQSAGLNTTPIRAYITQLRVMDSMQKQIGNSMRAMQFQQMGTQLNAFSQRMTNAGTRITMGLTLPLVAFFRMGFQSFKALDKQVIRTSKLMADSFDDSVKNATGASKGFTDLGFALKQLGDGLDKITDKWGVSRELVQGLAGDFAELGISAPGTLARLTELTVEFEKLGNIDIAQAQSTIQAMFQTISRIRTDKGLDVSSTASLKQMTEEINGAISFFNFAENKTTLSLNNIAEAFPEVTAAATSFGLNMQTTAAMLVPMIGAAFQTGASANSIKVSLQRMVATTKQNADMLRDLSDVLGDDFASALDVSANGVMGLINNYDLLLEKFGQKGALQFMSKLFGVRQGPRMEVSIAQMNKYQKALKEVGTQEQRMAEGVERTVNAQLKLAGYGDSDMIKIRNLKDINDLTLKAQEMNKDTGEYTAKALRIQAAQKIAMENLEKQSLSAGKQRLDEQGKIIVDNTKKQAKQNKIGEEFNNIQTEAGKLLTGQLYGKSLTEKNKNDELERVRKSIEVQYGIARENVKSISRELVTVFGDVLQVLNPILKKISAFIRDLSPQTKKIIGVVLLALVAIGPLMRTIGAVGQLGAMFSNARAAGIRRFRGNVVELNDSLMRTSDIALRLGGKFQKFGQDGKIFTSRKDAKRLEKLAPIIAKQDRGEELTAKEKMKGTKYVRQLAGAKAVKDGTALFAQKNFYGLDQATKDYVRSLDPVFQANQMVSNILAQQAEKTRGIFRKTAQKILKIRSASNNASSSGIDPSTGGIAGGTYGPALPTPAPITSAIGGITTLRDILTQILTTLQAIQACVCNAKAAATGRPSPAASGAPTNAPPFYPTPTGAAIPATTVTGTSAPAGAAATIATEPIATATASANKAYAELVLQSPLWQKYNGGLKEFVIVAQTLKLPIEQIVRLSSGSVNLAFASAKTIAQDANLTKVLLEKYGIDINKIVDQLRQSVVTARNNIKSSIKPKTLPMVDPTVINNNVPTPASLIPPPTVPAIKETLPPGFMNPMAIINAMKPVMPQAPAPVDIKPAVDKAVKAVAEAVTASTGKKQTPPAANPIPAAIDTATIEAEKTVATNVVEGAKKKGGRPKGSKNKPKAAPFYPTPTGAPIDTSIPAIPVYPMQQAKDNIVKAATQITEGIAKSGDKLTVDFSAIGNEIVSSLGMIKDGRSFVLTKEALIKLFLALGEVVPANLQAMTEIINTQTGAVVKTSAEGVAKLAANIKLGITGAAIDAGSSNITGQKGSPLYVEKLNTGYGKATETGTKRSTKAEVEAKAVDASSVEAEAQKDFQARSKRIVRLRQNYETLDRLQDQMFLKLEGLFEQLKAADNAGNVAKSEAITARIKSLQSGMQRAKTLSAETVVRATQTSPAEVTRRSGRTTFQVAQIKRQDTRAAIERELADQEEKLQRATTYSRSIKGLPGIDNLVNIEKIEERLKVLDNMLKQVGKPLADAKEARSQVAASQGRLRYVDVAYGKGSAKGQSVLLQERKSVTRPGGPKAVITEEARKARNAGIEAARKFAAEYRAGMAQAGELRTVERTRQTPQEQALREQGGTVVKRQMTQEDLLRINSKDISAAESARRTIEERILAIKGQISDINSQARVPGGKPEALRPLKAGLKELEKELVQIKKNLTELTTLPAPVPKRVAKERIKAANAPERDAIIANMPADPNRPDRVPSNMREATRGGGGGRVGGTSMLTDPFGMAIGGMQPRGPKAPRMGPMSMAFMDTGAVTGGVSTVYGEIQAALKIPADIMQQVIKDLEAKHAQITSVGKAAVTSINGKTTAVVESLKKSIVDPANATVEEVKQAIVKARGQFAKLETDAMKAARTGAPVAPSAKAPSAPVNKAAYGFGLESAEQKVLAEQIKSQIIAQNKAAIDFMQFESKTLEYIGRAFAIEGRGKGKKEVVVNNLIAKLKEMGIAVEKAIVTEAIAPVTAATNAVTTTATTGAGATADETAKVVEAEKSLTVAVEKTIADAAKAVTLSAVAAANPRLAAIASGAKLSPLASSTTGVVGPKATDSTPAVAVRTPYSMPYVDEINSQVMNTKATVDSIAENLKIASSGTAKQVQALLAGIQALVRSVHGAQLVKDFALMTGGNIPDALKYLDRIIQEKLVQEAEKVKTVTAAVTAVPVTPAPPVAPTRPASSSIPLSPEGSKSSGVVVNPATKVMLDAARAAAETVAAVSSSYKPEIIRESGRIVVDAERNLVRAIEEQLIQTGQLVNRITSDIIATGKPKLDVPVGTAKALIGQMDKDIVAQSKARAEAEKARVKAEMDARIRQNVFESARIRTLTGGAGRFAPPPPPPTMMGRLFDGAKNGVRGIGRRARSSIIGAAMAPSIATPKQLFSGSARMPDSAEITGTIAKIANPVRIGTMLGKAYLFPATAIAKKVSSPSAIQKVNDSIENTINRFNLFFRKPVIKTDLFATRVGTSRQTIKAGLERDDVARGVSPATSRQQRIINKTANRTATNNVSVSRFESLANGMVSKVQAFGVKISGALRTANSVIDPSLGVATLISGQIIKAPVTLAQVYTKAVVAGHKVAFNVISKGLTLLSSQTGSAVAKLAASNFAQSTIAGKSILYVAQTLQKGLVGLASGIGNLPTTIGTGLNLTVNAIKNPKASLISAGKGLLSAASTIKDGAGKLTQAAMLATAAGTKMAAGAIGNAAMAPVRGVKTMFVGGKFVSQGQDAAGNTIETKKGGLFGRTVTRTTDASGMMTEQRGPGMLGRMKGGIGKGVMGGIRGLGTAAGSMSSMMLYQLGPAGMALQGPMNKVISLLTRTKMAFFSVTLPIMLVVGAIFLLKKTFNTWKDSSTGVAENFGKAWKAIMAVVNMLKTAFFDFFASLFGGAEDSDGATANIGRTVSKVAETVRKFAEGFKSFFEKNILPAIYTFLSGLSLIIRSIVSFVGNLIKFVAAVVSFFRGGGDKSKEAMGNAFKGMVKAVGNALKGIIKMALPILNLLVKAVFKVVELIVQLFEWLVIGIINIIRYMVKGVINLSFGIVKSYVFIIDKVIELFVLFEKAAINIALATVRGVVNVFFGILKGVVFVVQKVIDLFAMIPAGVGKGFSLLGSLVASLLRKIADKIPGFLGWAKKMLNGFADGLEGIGEGAEEAGKKAQSGLNGILDPVTSKLQAGQNKILGIITGIGTVALKSIDKLKNIGDTVNRVLTGIQNTLLNGVDVGADAANAFIGGFSDAIASLGNSVTDWLGNIADGDDIKRGIGDAVKEGLGDAAKDPSAATAAGKSIAEAIGKGITSLKQNFYDKVVDNLGGSLGKLKDQITKALEKQKDQSLKFFDDQIAAIDALAAADAELTAEKQRQEDERLRIAERALQRDSYLKNRALAIYEGRIDDARTMALEEAKNQQDFNKETEKNARDAQAAAKAKNVEAAKKVIENQKQVASNQFDKDLEDFQTFIENIGKNGTLTAAELTTQFNELKAKADSTSSGMQSAFQGYYNALPTLIANNTAPTVGFFTSSMDALIAGAQAKYGLDTGVTDPTTMLGITNGMMSNLGTVYTNGFSTVVAPAYNDGQELLAGIARQFADPSASNPNSAAGIYAIAIANATAAVRAEFMKMKTEAGSAFAEVVGAINDELKNLAISQAIKDATEELKNTGGGANPSGGSATSPATGVTGPTAPSGYGPNGLTEAGFLSKAGADRVFKLNDRSSYIKAAKAALAFYGFTGFDVNSDKMGTGTVKAIKAFQTKYKVASGSGNLGSKTAGGLGLFNKVGVQKKFMGGIIRREAGGAVPGYTTQGVPAILHGGEYVISSKAVQNLGLGVLTQLNGLKHGVPSFNVPKPQMPSASKMNMSVTSHSTSETTQNYNFYVDNFIGEDQWFESMMKDYNVKVVPNNQKAAGLESRVVRTYNGLNRGM